MSLQYSTPTMNSQTQGPTEAARHRNRFLSNLSQSDMAILTPFLLDRPLRPGECLHKPGQLIEWVIFPHSGIISLTVPSIKGISVETGMIGREGIASGGVGFGIPHSLCTAVVQLPGSASAISARHYQQAMSNSSEMREQAARCAAVLLLQAQQSAACNALHDVEQRLARWLLEIHDRAAGENFPLTQICLAEMLGVQRTTVTLVAGKLQKIGAIRNHRGHVEIADRALLQTAACECYQRVRACSAQLFGAEDSTSGRTQPGQQKGMLA